MLRLFTLLLGVALLLTGSGLLGTLLAVRGAQAGFDDRTLGLVMSCYFAGYFFGTFIGPPLIGRIGHIRAFAFFAALAAIAVLLHPIWLDPWAWGLLRLVTGVALVGLYTVIESWLNAEPNASTRARVFSVYMMVNLSALALGQVLLGWGGMAMATLFSLTAILLCASVMPVAATRLQQPEVPPIQRFSLRRLYALAPAATVGAALSGLAMGGFWGLSPVYASRIGLDTRGVALFMLAAIAGGALLQVPIGRISDGRDRRLALALAALAAAGVALAMLLPAVQADRRALFGLFFLFGGLSFSLYPFAVAHMLDYLPREHLLSGCSSLLLVNGVGSAIGPALAGGAMQRLGPSALPIYFAVMLIALAAYLFARLRFHRDRTFAAPFRPMLRTTPTALELMPETEPPSQPQEERFD
ncbi:MULTISPECIES: MFS transporter [Pseudoxanthomonas]|jgi:MFS family permease|uniref:MFS transporter n=1 Tax=Pseudoxanthomonas winnipegensis TaxID=2480810 RepID=A0A4Q8LQ22_9GAMM|nr:MFS transporter [Pseudoxanthomonas winnipegensis]RZZ89182.1 MFS transporter [Pseudoxanthomonas winnipegensis]TAA10609.1 MFS transporter [Pseudoxanthomonas winnipegensis]TAA22234.1 MFS transporter [Pseudoxanthomonas winnipegensis]TAA33368.1 MFS transporter [Pseudoxanthomonas winnipegensis]TAA44043.1 MFS transporter [Pseudoxanthomonas winnipegensis]